MGSISIVIITFNAAAQLDQTLGALSSLSDDIVVVDSNSTDHTEEVCKKHNAKFYNRNWLGYGATKNLGAELAKNNWILSIDSDEVISPELATTIQNWVPEAKHVYALDRINLLENKWIEHSGWYPDWKPRLYDKTKLQWDLSAVHEELIIPSDFTLKKLAGKLYHYAYPTLDDHYQKMLKYARLSAVKMKDQGKKYHFLKAIFAPYVRFFKTLLIKKGFLDGKAGLMISVRNAQLVKLKYKFLKELETQQTS